MSKFNSSKDSKSNGMFKVGSKTCKSSQTLTLEPQLKYLSPKPVAKA